MPRSKSIFQKISLLVGSLLAVLLLSEIVLRFSGYSQELVVNKNDSDFIVEEPASGYVYKPNLDTVISNSNYRIRIKTNSYGYRDDEWNLPNEKNAILVLGDSFTAGYGVNKEQRWSDQLNRLIAEAGSNEKYRIYNAAVSGYSLQQIEATFDKMFEKVNAKAVIIGLNINVLDRLMDPYIYFRGFSLKKSKVPYAVVDNNRLYILRSKNPFLKRIEFQIVKYSLLYDFVMSKLLILKNDFTKHSYENENALLYETGKILLGIKKKSISSNIRLIILPIVQHNKDMKFGNEVLSRYQEIRKFCTDNRIEFVDMLPAIDSRIKSGSNFWIGADPHWNKIVHQIAAFELSRYFISVKVSAKGVH